MTPEQQQLFDNFPKSVQACLLRIGRRIKQGFEGTVEVQAHRGGVGYIRWSEVERGDTIQEELNSTEKKP